MNKPSKNEGAKNHMVATRPANQTSSPTQGYHPEKGEEWFEKFIHILRVNKMQLETNTASPELVQLYSVMSGNDELAQMKFGRDMMNTRLTKMALVEYLKKLLEYNNFPTELAFDYADSKVRVWAIVEDEDEDAQDALLLAAAFVNAKYQDLSFSISSTIVEVSDELEIPSHYVKFSN
jgi:hypothetical protein